MLYIMNTSIIPPQFEGRMVVKNISLFEARGLMMKCDYTSAVGHQSSADVLTELLEVIVPMNRVSIRVQSGDSILAFQLEERLAEGITPTAEMLMNLKYTLRLITFE